MLVLIKELASREISHTMWPYLHLTAGCLLPKPSGCNPDSFQNSYIFHGHDELQALRCKCSYPAKPRGRRAIRDNSTPGTSWKRRWLRLAGRERWHRYSRRPRESLEYLRTKPVSLKRCEPHPPPKHMIALFPRARAIN